MSFNSQAIALAAETSARRRDDYRHGLAQLQPAGRGHNTHGSLLGIANKCPIHKALLGRFEIATELRG